MRPILCLLIFTVACTTSEAVPVCGDGGSSPPKNPFLADSIYAIPHGNSAQQDSTTIAGPTGPTKDLSDEERNYQQIGPGHFGIYISSPYADGSRVIRGRRRQPTDFRSTRTTFPPRLTSRSMLRSKHSTRTTAMTGSTRRVVRL